MTLTKSVYRAKIRSPAVAKVGRPYRLYSQASVRLSVAERKQFWSDYSLIHAMVMLLYRTLQLTL